MDNEELKVALECIHENLIALQILAHYEDHRVVDYYKAIEPNLAMLEEVINGLK